jgi:hypothetical protein
VPAETAPEEAVSSKAACPQLIQEESRAPTRVGNESWGQAHGASLPDTAHARDSGVSLIQHARARAGQSPDQPADEIRNQGVGQKDAWTRLANEPRKF